MSARALRFVHQAVRLALAAGVAVALQAPVPASAQPAAPPPDTDAQPPAESSMRAPSPPASRSAFQVRGFADVGFTTFTAADTFRAVFGKPGGPVFGGGVQVVHRSGYLVQLNASRFSKTGERVFIDSGEVFKLGIPLTLTLMPIELTGGYRFFTKPPGPPKAKPGQPAPKPGGPPRVFPYAGGGVGFVSVREKSDFSDSDVTDLFTSYHVLGGADFPLSKWFGVGGELAYRWVPNALGDSGAAAEYKETDLGGLTFRLRVTVGR